MNRSLTKSVLPPKGICFDVGNVLFFPDGKILSEMLTSFLGHQPDETKCQNSFLLADRDGFRLGSPSEFWQGSGMYMAWGKHMGIEEDKAREAWELINNLNRTECQWYPQGGTWWSNVNKDADYVLNEIKNRNIKLGVISNTDGFMEKDLEKADLGHYFLSIIDSKVVGIEKPSPQIYHLGATGIGLQPNECWYIGDTIRELYGAKEAGIGLPVLFDPLNIFHEFTEFPRIVDLKNLLALIDLNENVSI